MKQNKSEEVKIIKLPVSRWHELRKLRLDSLKSDPLAFARDFEEEAQKHPIDYIKSLLERILFFAEREGKLIGFCGMGQFSGNRKKHLADVGPLYVDSAYRGKGIGKQLMIAVEEEAKRKGVKKLKLSVNVKQKDAVAFYKKMGFRKVGTLKNELRIGNTFYDLYEMEKEI